MFFEEAEVWLDSEPALTKSNVASYMEDGVGGQLMQLEPIETEKAPEERMQGNERPRMMNARNITQKPTGGEGITSLPGTRASATAEDKTPS